MEKDLFKDVKNKVVKDFVKENWSKFTNEKDIQDYYKLIMTEFSIKNKNDSKYFQYSKFKKLVLKHTIQDEVIVSIYNKKLNNKNYDKFY